MIPIDTPVRITGVGKLAPKRLVGKEAIVTHHEGARVAVAIRHGSSRSTSPALRWLLDPEHLEPLDGSD